MTTLLIDNYDSFSYNLYQLVGELDPDIRVIRNDELTVDEVLALAPSRVIISPGPGRPEEAGICVELIRRCRGKFPILGVCLGHQAICVAYGATVTYAAHLMHGKSSTVDLSLGSALFRGLGGVTTVGRYHSLAVDRATLPADLKVTAETADREVMAVEDRPRKVFGVQFHPESILTPAGRQIIRNFLEERV